MQITDIADMLEFEADDARQSAAQVEITAALIGLSNDAATYESTRWQRRANRMQAAAETIRGLIAHPVPR